MVCPITLLCVPRYSQPTPSRGLGSCSSFHPSSRTPNTEREQGLAFQFPHKSAFLGGTFCVRLNLPPPPKHSGLPLSLECYCHQTWTLSAALWTCLFACLLPSPLTSPLTEHRLQGSNHQGKCLSWSLVFPVAYSRDRHMQGCNEYVFKRKTDE